ncbi:MAG: hypothetical protein FJY29_01610 [Betaproteobacteria bacterium]|nr:hypothetical protein [Betaproteobacteria bacterium]
MSNKLVPESLLEERVKATDAMTAHDLAAFNFTDSKPNQTARVIGQPEGPFGTACVSKKRVLVRSLGTSHFSRFETAELAPHGLFITVKNPQTQPFKAKSTLLEFQLFLGDPQTPGGGIIKGIGRIEEIRAAVEVPQPTPSGYVFRILQLSGEELATLESFIHEILLKAAM